MAIRHRQVAVAVIYNEGFLLCHNQRWNGYAFPMKQVEGNQSPAEVALSALEDWDVPAQFPNATATPLDHVVDTLWSDGAREVTVYDYDVFEINTEAPVSKSLHPDLRWFTYQELQDAVNVTSSTKSIARSFVEDRKIVVSVLTRQASTGLEFLLVHNPQHGYFFPSTRIKSTALPAEIALQAARMDLGYEGSLQVAHQAAEVPALKLSSRFGAAQQRFYYHVCFLEAPNLDLIAPDNALEKSLNELATKLGSTTMPYYRWCSENELRTSPNMSPSVSAVLTTVLHGVAK